MWMCGATLILPTGLGCNDIGLGCNDIGLNSHTIVTAVKFLPQGGVRAVTVAWNIGA